MDQTQHTPVRAAAPDFLRVVSLAIVAWYHFWQQSWLNPNISIRGFVIDIYPLIRCGYMFVYNLILISGFVLMLSRLNGKYKTLPVAVQAFVGSYVKQWDLILTAALLAIIPMIIIFLVAQKQIMNGMIEGAVKG